MTHYRNYPFTAIIGQDLMKLALILNAINPHIGGVLIKGSKGTAKSTAVRALADLLPKIQVIRDCPFNCNPMNPKEACHTCQHIILENKLDSSSIEERPMRVINLPINATEDRVIGTVNIEKALTQGLKALEPGILAEAHRNILYIDEVNLLADNVADVLLDAAAMGINIIEREGISLHHPAKFILVGTMNPEEGHLRPQLLDRFGLSVTVEKITNIKQRVEIIKNIEEFQTDPAAFYNKMEPKQEELRQKIMKARELLPQIHISEELLEKIAQICIDFETEGHRADITINITAKTLAALDGHQEVTLENIKLAAQLTLPHRMRKLPFEQDHLDEQKLQESCQKIQDQRAKNEIKDNTKKNEELNHEQKQMINARQETFDVNLNMNTGELPIQRRIRQEMNATGNIISHPTESNKGKYISTKKNTEINIPKNADIAVLPTITSAALDPRNKDIIQSGQNLDIRKEHMHLKRRQGKSSFLIIFCVDASGSMGVENRMESAKGAVFSILQKNYVHRDKVSMIIFRDQKADMVLPPTRSTDLAYQSLKEIPTGGQTPLTAGLIKAYETAQEERTKATGYLPLIILISDGRGNVGYKDIITDTEKISAQIAQAEIMMVVIDTELATDRMGFAKKIAQIANASYFHIDHLGRQQIEAVLKEEGLLDE